jgi:hypothetical protein
MFYAPRIWYQQSVLSAETACKGEVDTKESTT